MKMKNIFVNKPMLSIIVPIYNVESYLIECVDSILKSTYMDYELLLIDDGSLDKSGDICDEFAQKDTRIKVFHKPNGGVSSARNLGLDNANGEWVTFIDADDHISPTFIESLMLPTLEHKNLDFVQGGCTNWSGGKPVGINQSYEDYIGCEPYIVFEKFRGLIFSKLFRLSTIRNLSLQFDEKMKIAEDMAFSLDYLLVVNEYVFISEVGYYYRIDNTSSITHSKQKRNFITELHSFMHLFESTIFL